MNIPLDSECPPPLPGGEISVADRGARESAPHLRARPWLLGAAVLSGAAWDAVFWTEDGLTAGYGGYGVAAGVALGAGGLVAMRGDLDFKKPEWAMLVATTVASAWVGSGISVALAPLLLLAAVRRPGGGVKSGVAPWVFRGPSIWAGAMTDAIGALLGNVFRGRSAAWGAAAATGAFFLVLLALGNAALARYVDVATRAMAESFSIRYEDTARVFFMGAGVLTFGLLAAPRPAVKPEAPAAPLPAGPAPVVFAALLGANLAFLASNLTDTYWLGFMRSAPVGVSSTEYLYDGAYVLMLDAAIAGALLLKLFSANGVARGDARAKFLGYALILQCAWLGLGVAGRLALQMDRYGFTPVRLWGVVLLFWGFAGLWGVARHLRKTPSFRAFLRLAVWSALGMLGALQFRPPSVLSVDLNLACYRSRPEWRFDDAYLFGQNAEGFRLSREILDAEPDSARGRIERERLGEWRVRFEGGSGSEWDDCGHDARNWRVRSLRHDALCEAWQSAYGAKSSP